jgi:putative transposase
VPNVREAAYLLGIYFRWYGEQDHDGIGGRKPLDVLQEGLGPGVDVSDLNYQFMWSKRVKTSRCRVTLFGIDYESDCLHGMGEDVIIRYETSNLAVLYCYTLGGQYLGEALPVQAMHPLASLFADEVSVDQVKAALARGRKLMKQTRQNLEAIGAPGGMTDGLKALPWNRRESLKVVSRESVGAGLKPAHTEETDQAEVKRLELIVSRTEEELQIERAQKPRVDRPEFFQSEASRYEWCFMARHKTGAELCDEDDAFMVYFEKTEEFGNNYRQRYADLLELYAMYGSELSRDA